MILAGDIGGTKTLLGLFDPLPVRPHALVVEEFTTREHDGLLSMIRRFQENPAVGGVPVDRAAFGVAGPVIGNAAQLTNVLFRVDAHEIATAFRIEHVAIVNDLLATALAAPVLREAELHVLQEGEALRGGNMALIAAGTGLGEALLHNVGGRFLPSASEGGHADFAARTEREIEVLRDIRAREGRASVEMVLSGRGLVNLYRVTHKDGVCKAVNLGDPHASAAISSAALEHRCDRCVETLNIFVENYGAESGNLALRSVSTGGFFVGGGIAPKILPALADGRFMEAFLDKHPFRQMLAGMPVRVILNRRAGLLGAAVHAAGL